MLAIHRILTGRIRAPAERVERIELPKPVRMRIILLLGCLDESTTAAVAFSDRERLEVIHCIGEDVELRLVVQRAERLRITAWM